MGFKSIYRNLANNIKNFMSSSIKIEKVNQIEETRLVGYDTSLVFVPKYKDLTQIQKERVDNYKREINLIQHKNGEPTTNLQSDNSGTSAENLIFYASELTQLGNQNRDLLIKLLYQQTCPIQAWQVENMQLEEVIDKRLDILINQEEMEAAKQELIRLKEEAVLRTVALEELEKEEKKITRRFFSVFHKSEQMKQKMQLELLGRAIERMKITIKTLEQEAMRFRKCYKKRYFFNRIFFNLSKSSRRPRNAKS